MSKKTLSMGTIAMMFAWFMLIFGGLLVGPTSDANALPGKGKAGTVEVDDLDEPDDLDDVDEPDEVDEVDVEEFDDEELIMM